MRQISVIALKEKLDNGESLCVLDVREQQEYDDVNINARLHPLSAIKNYDTEAIEDWKDKEVFIHCKSGVRSMQACMMLATAGFTNTVNVEGGIMAWLENYPDVKLP
jgi:rhodanese-related sulfurtransferase